MKTLVVGGAGYLGGAVVETLKTLAPKGNFTVYDSLLYEDQFLKAVPFVRGDVRDWSKLRKVIADHDSIVWLAAIVGDGACASNKEVTVQVNEEPVKKLSKEFPDKRIIFTSTCSVYGANNTGVLIETSRLNPLSIYAGTKLNAEEAIIKDVKNHYILRLGTLFGLSDEFSRIRFDLVVNKMAADAVNRGELTIFGGQQWRPLLHVRDVGDTIAYLASTDTEYMSGVYNLSYDNYIIKDIAEAVRKNTNASIKHVDQKFEDLRDYRVSTEKARRHLGFYPQLPIEVGISEIVRITKEGRIKDVNSPKHSNQGFLQGFYDTNKD